MKVAIADIRIKDRHRKDLGDLNVLTSSIADVGLLHPIVITSDNLLIAGQRRIEACKRLGWTEIPAHIVDLNDIVRGEYDENIVRKDFAPSEWVSIGRELEGKLRPQGRPPGFVGKDGNFPSFPMGNATRDKIATVIGTSGRTYEKARSIVRAAEEEPEKYTPLVDEMDRTGRVNGIYKKLKRMRQVEEIEREPPPLPAGPFRVIIVDPPWEYSNRADDSSHRASNPYPSMSLKEIKALPISNLAEDDAILWLWTTNAHLPSAFGVVKAWGFAYKTMLTWVKDRMGTGDWLRGQTEHCLMCVRGKPVVMLTNQTTVINGPLREHSRKPDEFYKLVESLCPGSKVDFYGRQQREGWTVYGDESTLFS